MFHLIYKGAEILIHFLGRFEVMSNKQVSVIIQLLTIEALDML